MNKSSALALMAFSAASLAAQEPFLRLPEHSPLLVYYEECVCYGLPSSSALATLTSSSYNAVPLSFIHLISPRLILPRDTLFPVLALKKYGKSNPIFLSVWASIGHQREGTITVRAKYPLKRPLRVILESNTNFSMHYISLL